MSALSSIALPLLLLAAVVALLAGGLLFMWLVRLNQTPTGPETIVALLLALLVAESALYANPSDVPAGIFHPTMGGFSFRVFDLLVPMALAARLFARNPVRAISGQALAWCAFLLWLAAAAVTGILSGNSTGLVAFHAKAIIYLGTFALVAAVPAHRWLESRALRNVVAASSVVAVVLLMTSQLKLAINIPNPLIPFANFGALGSDMASIFAVLGVGTFAVGLCSERARMRLLALSLPMLAAPLASGQRAAMIGLGASVLACALLGAFALRNVRITLPEIGLSAFAAVGLVTAILLANTLGSDVHRPLPIVKEIQDTFTSRGKQLSEQDRVNQWAQARGLISEHPLLGSGLGKQYNYYSPGFYEFMTTDLTHNIGLDLLLRTGVVGLLLFAVAVATTLRDATLAWLHDIDGRIAALGLAVFGGILGLIVKGMFESIFEKYRLAVLLGGLVGLSVSVAASRRAAAPAPARRTRLGVAEAGRGALAR